MSSAAFRSGFVNLVGNPNAGKSTLMNRLVGEKLSIVTAKAQTTRQRILGIKNADDLQIIYSDTPGVLQPKYALQKRMMTYVQHSLQDADVLLWLVCDEVYEETFFHKLKSLTMPKFLVINKADILSASDIEKIKKVYHDFSKDVFVLSAKTGAGVAALEKKIIENIPVHPPYFATDDMTDKSERFIASEIIRQHIFEQYQQEIPYSVEVTITLFKMENNHLHIHAVLYVERESQKGILIGKQGSALKKVGIRARKDLETFFGNPVMLKTQVKVLDKWRSEEKRLDELGYGV